MRKKWRKKKRIAVSGRKRRKMRQRARYSVDLHDDMERRSRMRYQCKVSFFLGKRLA
jgi:hypothetical protein